MTRTTQMTSVFLQMTILLLSLALSCVEEDDPINIPFDGPSVICDGRTLHLGPKCQTTYEQVVDCCMDEAMAKESASSLMCSMKADETACEQAGPSAAEAACTQMRLEPECGYEGNDGGDDTDSNMDTDTDTDTNAPKSCQGKCIEDADCKKMNVDVGLICKNSKCILGCRSSNACVPSRPECNLETNACECTSTSCGANQKCLASEVCGCANDDFCAILPATPKCDTATGMCQCTPTSCGENEKCLASGVCGCANDSYCNGFYTGFVCNTITGECECDADNDCSENDIMDTCYHGVCGCSSSDVCMAEDAYDNAEPVCEPISN